jgi:hypothetical protein
MVVFSKIIPDSIENGDGVKVLSGFQGGEDKFLGREPGRKTLGRFPNF